MTPLSTQAETGSAEGEAVAIALGWKEDPDGEWTRPHTGEWRTFCPDYQNDLPATLSEIERRGWGYMLGTLGSDYYCILYINGKRLTPSHGTTIALAVEEVRRHGFIIAHAACAALLFALEQQP